MEYHVAMWSTSEQGLFGIAGGSITWSNISSENIYQSYKCIQSYENPQM